MTAQSEPTALATPVEGFNFKTPSPRCSEKRKYIFHNNVRIILLLL